MPRGASRKQDFIKAGERAQPGLANAGDDSLSPTDKGKDFIKAGEVA